MQLLWFLLLTSLGGEVACHHTRNFRKSAAVMQELAEAPGVMVSFSKPVYADGKFLGFNGWDIINREMP